MAYFAGMIWSVSMLAPNFQALPRSTEGNVMCRPRRPALPGDRPYCLQADVGYVGGFPTRGACPPCAPSCDLGREVLQHLAGVRDDAGDRARRRDGAVREIDL